MAQRSSRFTAMLAPRHSKFRASRQTIQLTPKKLREKSTFASNPPRNNGTTSPDGHWRPPPQPALATTKKSTICIKAWSDYKNMAEVLCVLRTVERKYGEIAEHVILRDFEMPECYRNLIFAIFRDPASIDLIPPGLELHIPRPVVEEKPGGLGLSDIEGLLESQDHDPRFDRNNQLASVQFANSQELGNLIHVQISHATKDMTSKGPSQFRIDPQRLRESAIQLVNWGGFYPLEPIQSTRPIHNEELFGETNLDHVRMRAALRHSSASVRTRNPHETYPEEESTFDASHRPQPQTPTENPDMGS